MPKSSTRYLIASKTRRAKGTHTELCLLPELCVLPELGPRNYSYCSSHPERCRRFPALNSGCRGGCSC
eukprot:7041325-Pyramimonas_sp.AAC.1